VLDIEAGDRWAEFVHGGRCLRIKLTSGRQPVFLWGAEKEEMAAFVSLARATVAAAPGRHRPEVILAADGRFLPSGLMAVAGALTAFVALVQLLHL
jgi:hypothetical protein